MNIPPDLPELQKLRERIASHERIVEKMTTLMDKMTAAFEAAGDHARLMQLHALALQTRLVALEETVQELQQGLEGK
jgi:hypothetical protein